MGTSSSGGGAGGGNPLIPTWIPGGDVPKAPETDVENDGASGQNGTDDGQQPGSSGQANDNQNAQDQPSAAPATPRVSGNRYTQSRSDFNKFLRSGGHNTESLKRALRGYSKNAAGTTSGMARRMSPSAYRVASFLGALNTVRENGSTAALIRFNLGAYVNKPLSDILAGLSDEIFKNTDNDFANTQDDNITKQAYANTVIRVCELDNIDLDKLSSENIEVMTAIFIEETIVQRVICDIGNNMTKVESDIQRLIEIENILYQVVNGLVRNKIMPEIIATQRGDKKEIEKKMENIYRVAFDSMADLI